MLVLSRKAGQQIVIGNEITVTVTRVAGNRVVLGFDAPRNVRIVRGELVPFADGFGEKSAEEISDFEEGPFKPVRLAS